MNRPAIPPRLFWPGFIVSLLIMSITAVALTIVAATSDGGVQVVENYYEQAAAWDSTQARRAASDALGWQATLHMEPAGTEGLRAVVVSVRDAEGRPVDGLAGTVTARRPHRSAAVATVPLVESATPGVYRQALPVAAPGLWDFEVAAARAEDRFQAAIRTDVLPDEPNP
ncbi:MAG: FixH family protein [Rhodothermales bacterium]|nr:FixH family protein [Rhodothermales bacterium]